jgi:putative hydrolase of the HAD superfamily
MLKGVTFDLWFTLLPSTRDLDRQWERMRQRATYDILTEHGFLFDYKKLKTLLKAFDSQINRERKLNAIDFSTSEHVSRLIQFIAPTAVNNKTLLEQLKETYTRPIAEVTPLLGDGVPEMLATLKNQGWKIGLISNTGKTPGASFRSLFQQFGIMDYFDDCVFSDEAGFYKPNQLIFRAAEQHLGLQHNELVHVGDMISADICGALGAGWQAIYFNRYISQRYLDEDEQDARCIEKCPPQEIAGSYEEVVEKLTILRDLST